MENRIEVKTDFGTLIAEPSTDPNYPGIWVIITQPDDEGEYETSLALIEAAQDSEFPDSEKKLRVLVWADPDSEDYTDKIVTDFEAN